MWREVNHCFVVIEKPKQMFKTRNLNKFNKFINKLKESIICSLKFWVTLICIIGFLYQLWDATEDYLEYRTVAITQTRYQLESMTSIPAITFCSEVFFDLHRIALDFEDFDQYLKKNMKIQSNLGLFEKRALKFRTIYEFLEKNIEDFNFLKAFNYSIDFSELIKDCIIYNDSRAEICHKNGSNGESKNANQSFSIEMFQDYKKCETFRTHLIETDLTISDHLTTIGSIELTLNRIIKEKLDNYLELEVTIHSPYEIPIYPDGFIKLKRDFMHTLRYWTRKTVLLPDPYDTHCYDYNSDPKSKSKDDCAFKCQDKELKNICRECIPDLVSIRKDLLKSGDKLCKTQQLCNSFDKKFRNCSKQFTCGLENLQDIYFSCNTRCKTSCKTVEYHFTSIEDILNEDTDQKNTTLVNIEPKLVPKVALIYRPSISRTNFVANIGGIGSFWLGLTVLELYEIGHKFSKIIITKFNK